MKERLLIKCDTTIYADEITNLLIENNIVSRQHDEGQDQNPGAYGAITGIATLVVGVLLVWLRRKSWHIRRHAAWWPKRG